MALSVTATAVSPANSLLMEPSPAVNGIAFLPIQAARQTSRRLASMAVLMSASMKAMPWFSTMGRPNCSRVLAYSSAYS